MNKAKRAVGVLIGTLLCAAAAAQSVTLYGVVDSGVEHVTNVGASGSGLTRVPTLSGQLPSRLGFRGAEDLGDGLKALFALEMGFGTDTGALGQGGRAFGRASYVGLAGTWGAVTVGRQYNMYFWSLGEADILGPNVHGMGATLDPYIANARWDNSIAYRGTFSGLTVGAMYSLGRDAINNCAESVEAKACRAIGGLLKYDTPNWGLALGYDEQRGVAGVGAYASSNQKDVRISGSGYVMFSGAKLTGGLIRRDNDTSALTPKSDLMFLQASYLVATGFTIDGQVARLDFKNSSNDATVGVARATYSLSRRTATYVSLARVSNRGVSAVSVSGGAVTGSAPAAGGSQNGVMVGVRHFF